MARSGGIVLAGGRSSRMGTSKAALEWHGSTLLRRVCGLIARAVEGPVVVVGAPDQELPALPAEVRVVRDRRQGRGPLEGLAAGLAALEDEAEVVYLSATDVPLLHPQFVRAVVAGIDGAEVALPNVHGFRQPLAAAYRTSLRARVEELLGQGRLRPAHLFDRARVRELDAGALLADPLLAAADPRLESVLNLNDRGEYERVRARPAPEVVVERFGVLRPAGTGQATLRVRAATLGAAAAAAEVALDEHVVAALNGEQISRDPQLPLVAGDAVALMSADAGG